MWGTYELIAKIPKASAPASSDPAFDFEFEDENAITGFTYWYYVSGLSRWDVQRSSGSKPRVTLNRLWPST